MKDYEYFSIALMLLFVVCFPLIMIIVGICSNRSANKKQKKRLDDLRTKNIARFKRFDEMNRKDKRAYRKYLSDNEIWDGEEVLDRLEKNGDLKID